MIKNYQNNYVSTFFNRICNDENREWVWRVLNIIQKEFPEADHWTTGGSDTKTNSYIDIRIGKRSLKSKKGSPVIYLKLKGGGIPYYFFHKKIRGDIPKELNSANFIEQNTDKKIEEWLRDHSDKSNDQLNNLIAEGHYPKDYATPGDYDEESDDNVELPDRPNEWSAPPPNQILFGPPGTGKTFATINAALEVLDSRLLHDFGDNREKLKERFDQLVKENRIRFVTFHQSFSYEDFVEGLRAVNDEATGQLQYKVVDGVFKSLCKDGSLLRVGQSFGQGYVVRRVGSDVVEFDKPRGGVLPLPLSLVRQLLAYVRDGKIDVEDIRKGQVFEKVPESDLEKFIINGYPSLFAAIVEQLLKHQDAVVATDARVLIIDEINRGNVSRIFGELITLIEPSKRAVTTEESRTADESLSVVLPYSKEPFSVPSNVYLIGTMNTADRSLTSLDIALRRRFVFKEMLPDHQLLKGVLVEGINIGELLEVMNQRIEVLLDRDHCLGHAYFMPLIEDRTLERLQMIFRNQVLPLLQEYFFEDWQRIQWVLNDHRKPKGDCFVERVESDLAKLFGSEVTAVQGGIWRVMPGAFKRASAYAGIIATKSKEQSGTGDPAEQVES